MDLTPSNNIHITHMLTPSIFMRNFMLLHLHAYTCVTLIHLYNLENFTLTQLRRNVMIIIFSSLFRVVIIISQLQCNYANHNPMTL